MKFMEKRKIKFSALIIAVIFISGISFYVGNQHGQAEKIENIPVANAQGETILNADFSLFWDAVKIIKNKYFDAGNITDEQILHGAINGAFESLGDPYSSFFEPSDAKKFHEDLNGVFGGIGAEIGEKDNVIVIVAPLKGNPAEAIGLKAGDKILEINGTSTIGMTVENAVKTIRGEPDTKVSLLVIREGWGEAKEFVITRQIVKVPTLEWETKKGNVAYIKLHNFNANVSDLMYQTVFSILLNRPNGIILDLRNNPGGFLDVAIDTAGWFVDRGAVIVREKFNGGNEDVFFSNGNASLSGIPLVVLVNGGSASASEILAGTLRDIRNVKLVGEKTFGKGTVQEVRDLRDGSSIKISIAEWLTPNGTSINESGLEPDFVVQQTEEDIKNGTDPQLEKALDILEEETGLSF